MLHMDGAGMPMCWLKSITSKVPFQYRHCQEVKVKMCLGTLEVTDLPLTDPRCYRYVHAVQSGAHTTSSRTAQHCHDTQPLDHRLTVFYNCFGSLCTDHVFSHAITPAPVQLAVWT